MSLFGFLGKSGMQQAQHETSRWGAPRIVPMATLGLLLVMVVFAAGFVTGSSLTVSGAVRSDLQVPIVPFGAPGAARAEEEVDLGVFWEVWNTLESRFYYDLPPEEERIQGAIEGLIESINDPYTAYVPPEAARILNEDSTGTFEGIGAFVEEAPGGGVYIIRVFEGGPADQAGLRAGDIVVGVDGVDITDKILGESLLLIRGPAGTEVTVTVVRNGEPELLEFTIERARLEVPTVESRLLEDGIGYVALFEFNARASERLRNAIRNLRGEGAQSLILDLRDNPGGFLDESIRVADLFLGESVIVIQRDVDGKERSFTSDSGDLAEDIPLVVLVNENSASASEIVAAAIQDNERGTLIGQTTFGKGSVQLQYDLSDGSLLRVTYAAWYTPNDRSITGQGATPDIIVETSDGDAEAQTDIQLERAVEFLRTGQ